MHIFCKNYLPYLLACIFLYGCQSSSPSPQSLTTYDITSYPLHRDITATLFWIGEDADIENGYIANHASAWDDDWLSHYGGIDSPRRTTLFPADFTPHENPFYYALPYNDFDDSGVRRSDVSRIPWYASREWDDDTSIVKNRWIRITDGTKTVYAQWEDSGPFVYDDTAYVFGTARPANTLNNHAGIDLSPAVWIYLGYDTTHLDTSASITWQFVEETEVPDGPWKQIITTRQITWH